MLFFSVLIMLGLEIVNGGEYFMDKPYLDPADKTIMIKITPESVFRSFQAVISSDYLRELAEEFAKKAAEHFLSAMKNEQRKFRQNKLFNDTELYQTAKPKIEKHIVNKAELMTLLREPSLDGDYLEPNLSDETSTVEERTVRLKINGAYYKRHNLPGVTADLKNSMDETTKPLEPQTTTSTTSTMSTPTTNSTE